MRTRLFLIVVMICIASSSFSQKMTPDIDLISEIVAKKQDEIKHRFIKNIVVKNIKTTNYTTYNSMYNLMNILTTEKNKTVMSKSIIELVANYSINYALANDFMRSSSFSDSSIKSRNTSENNLLGVLILEGIDDNKTDVENRKSIAQLPTQDSRLGNYIVDKFFEKLIAKQIPELTAQGLFKKELLDSYFTDGLEIDYSQISNANVIDSEIDNYLDNFSSNLRAGVGVYDFLSKNIKDLSNLKNISKEDVQKLFELFSFSLEKFKDDKGGNSFLSKIGSIVTKYVIYEFNDGDANVVFNSFKIDVEAIILDLEDNFFLKNKSVLKNHFIGIKPFFTIGMNYGTFTSGESTILSDDNTSRINDVSFVGEKIGVKIILADFGYTRSHKPKESFLYRGTYRYWQNPVVSPLINDIYLSVYGSGILYNVVNLKSKENFDFGLVAANAGVTFFNGLEVNISYGIPIINRALSNENTMVIVGLDIPIFEYIRALKKQ